MAGTTDRDVGQFVIFELAGRRYALPVVHVREVLPRATIVPVPDAPASLVGVLRLRGELVPVIDLRQRLGLPCTEPQLRQRIIVALVGSCAVGMVADAVEGLVPLDDGVRSAMSFGPGSLVQGVVETAAGVVTVLDAAAVMGEVAASVGLGQRADAEVGAGAAS